MQEISTKVILSAIALISLLITGCAPQLVMLDNYYNNERHAKTGRPFHYIWEDTAMSGFSQLGALFRAEGAVLSTLKEKPDAINLKKADVYIIVDPDTEAETAQPNYMDEEAAEAISDWVKKGGVLLLLTNDEKNAELEHFNTLANKFGMQYNKVLLHRQMSGKGEPRDYLGCTSANLPDHPLFNGISKIYLKEVSSITCTPPAKPILTENGENLMAEARYGQGYVLAVGDPWLYNEYIDHWVLPTDYENLKAAKNLVGLLLSGEK